MYKKELKDLREKRGVAYEAMNTILKLTEKENRTRTEDEKTKYAALDLEMDEYDERIKDIEKMQSRDMGEAEKGIEGKEQRTKDVENEEYRAAFNNYLARGMAGLNDAEKEIIQRGFSSDVAENGGYLVPDTFVAKLTEKIKTMGSIMPIANVITTGKGENIIMPTATDDDNEGVIVGENEQVPDGKTPKFDTITIGAFTFSTKPIRVPNNLLQDSFFNLESWLIEKMAKRITNLFDKYSMIGNGTTQPQGLLTATKVGATAASDAITYDNLIDLQHSIDAQYRKNATWVFSDNTLKALRKLKDADGKPIWQPSMLAAEPSMILGKPYRICNYMQDIATAQKSVLFGDFKQYTVRMVKSTGIQRLVERYSDFNQTGFIGFKRMDAKLLDAGLCPIKHLLHA